MSLRKLVLLLSLGLVRADVDLTGGNCFTPGVCAGDSFVTQTWFAEDAQVLTQALCIVFDLETFRNVYNYAKTTSCVNTLLS